MFCVRCGKQISDDSTFCQHCGLNLSVSQNNNQPMPNNPNLVISNNSQDNPSGMSNGMRVCQGCGFQLPNGVNQCPRCGKKKTNNKPVIICLVIMFLFFGIVGTFTTTEEPVSEEITPETITEKVETPAESVPEVVEPTPEVVQEPKVTPEPVEPEKPKYLTSVDWALWEQPYVCCVEIDDYNGDILESGTYNFSLVAGRLVKGKCLPAMFDVLICDVAPENISNFNLTRWYEQGVAKGTLKSGDSFDYIGFTIGGIQNYNTVVSHNLSKGQYVYVVGQKMVLEPTGYLHIEKVN